MTVSLAFANVPSASGEVNQKQLIGAFDMAKQITAVRYVVNGHEYSNSHHEGRRKVTTTGPRPFTMQEATHERHLAYVADFTVEIDIPAIIDLAIRRCQHTKGGKSQLLDKLIICKRSDTKVTKNELKERPLHRGYELVEITEEVQP